ncbi:MAG: LCP family protein [Lachnospiraceae bacterium]|nr:LCP family protein [Lachnospiraceae bacterium]
MASKKDKFENATGMPEEGSPMTGGPEEPKKKRKKGKFIALLVLEILLVLLVAAGAVFFFWSKNKVDNMQRPAQEAEETFAPADVVTNPDIPEEAKKTMREKYTTFMIYGVDARNNRDLVKYANADTDIICCINNETKEVKLVSILRDTFLETSNGKHTKLTDIYAGYGVQESIQTINRCCDLTITQYVTVNWTLVAKIIQYIGGIDIELSNAEAKAINDYSYEISTISGIPTSYVEARGRDTYHLDGVQAAAYCRIRSVGHHDITRAERQRKVISIALTKVKAMSLTEQVGLLDMATQEGNIATNFSYTELMSILTDVGSYWIGEQTLFPFEGQYKDQRNLSTAYVYCNTLSENVTMLHKFLYGQENYQPSGTVEEVSDYITSYRKEHP